MLHLVDGTWVELPVTLDPDARKVYATADSLSPFCLVVGGDTSNQAPTAAPQTLTTAGDAALPLTLAGSDPDGDPLTFRVLTGPQHGTLSGTAPALTYTPAAGYRGSDSFTYVANDGQADSEPATVTIEVQLTPSDHIAGTVSDQDGSPLEGVVVHVTGTSEYTGVTDAAGHYDIGPLSEARYFVWATDTYHQTPDGVWVELPDDPSAQVDFEMLPAGALSCRISGAGGGAIPFAGMTLLKNYDGVWLDQYGASVR